jgi:hypothetical protein
MKRATLSAIPASTPASAGGDLTDRLLNRESVKASGTSAANPPAPARAPTKTGRARAQRPAPMPAKPAKSAPEADALGQALLSAQQAVEALQAAGRAEPARYEVALRFRLDSLAHHVQQVKDYVAATLAR